MVLNAAMRAIQQAIELIGAPTGVRMRAVRRVLRGAVIVAEDAGKVAPLPGTAYVALATHGQAPAQPEADMFPMSGDEDDSDLGLWQSGETKPTIEGTYLREFDEGQGISEFNEGKWLRDGFFPSDIQDARWRGRTSPKPTPTPQSARQRSDLVPGVMYCAKCKFQLNRVTLCVSDGNAYAGNNKTEPCPNGCGPLWPVTWEQEAKNCWKALEEMHERLMAAAAPQPSPTAQAADSVPAPPPPPECETEAEKRAFAFGWFKALESERMKADSVQEDAARLDFLIEQRAYVVSDPDACPGYWLHWARPDGRTWVQGDEHPTPRAAIDAGRKQGARWQSAVRALTLHI